MLASTAVLRCAVCLICMVTAAQAFAVQPRAFSRTGDCSAVQALPQQANMHLTPPNTFIHGIQCLHTDLVTSLRSCSSSSFAKAQCLQTCSQRVKGPQQPLEMTAADIPMAPLPEQPADQNVLSTIYKFTRPHTIRGNNHKSIVSHNALCADSNALANRC